MPLLPGDILPLLRNTPKGVFLSCRIQPRSSRNALGDRYGDALKIFLTAPPVDGKANEALCRFLADASGLPKADVHLESGQTSRSKVILFTHITPELLAERLCAR